MSLNPARELYNWLMFNAEKTGPFLSDSAIYVTTVTATWLPELDDRVHLGKAIHELGQKLLKFKRFEFLECRAQELFSYNGVFVRQYTEGVCVCLEVRVCYQL